MSDIPYRNFKSYVKSAGNIFDIMAAAYKVLYPFEPMVPMGQDPSLHDFISCFSQQHNISQAFAELKEELLKWLSKQDSLNKDKLREKLFFLIRLIDGKCVRSEKSFLPDSYTRYFSLNHLFQNEICILPRPQNGAVDLLSESIKKKAGYGFYGRNYSRTSDISGYLKNFVIYRVTDITPHIIIPNYYREILQEFERKQHKLKVAVFPLSSLNLNRIFMLREDLIDKEGLFYIESPINGPEHQILERCKEALRICRNQQVDIAVFPEMLFTSKNQHALIDFVKGNDCYTEEMRFPWFIWLGTAWAEKENKCMVIDQYGKIVFEQKKHVPYEYRKKDNGNIPETGTSDKTVVREALSHKEDRIANFLDLPGFLRIATAICRDISDNHLTTAIKELYTDMVVIPAFSKTDRLTERYVNPLALERIISLVCNACSALCEESEECFEVNEQMIGREHVFSYLCLPAKKPKDNAADYHTAHYTSLCKECVKCCNGYIWEIDFTRCVIHHSLCCAEVI